MSDITSYFDALKAINKEPGFLDYVGNKELLNRPIISIVGSRNMSLYTKGCIEQLVPRLTNLGIVIASGGAIGVDIVAANAAYPNTIAILPSGLNYLYPKSNAALLGKIAQNGLLISEYAKTHRPIKADFLHRNRLVVALADILIIAQADFKSGSLNSASWAKELNKPIYVLAQPAGHSNGTMQLVNKGAARLIYDLDIFISEISELLKLNISAQSNDNTSDELLDAVRLGADLEALLERFGEAVYDYELDGKITISGAQVRVR